MKKFLIIFTVFVLFLTACSDKKAQEKVDNSSMNSESSSTVQGADQWEVSSDNSSATSSQSSSTPLKEQITVDVTLEGDDEESSSSVISSSGSSSQSSSSSQNSSSTSSNEWIDADF